MKKKTLFVIALVAVTVATACFSGCEQSNQTEKKDASTSEGSVVSVVSEESKESSVASTASEEGKESSATSTASEESKESSVASTASETSQTSSEKSEVSKAESSVVTKEYTKEDAIRYGKILELMPVPLVDNPSESVVIYDNYKVCILEIKEDSYVILFGKKAALVPKDNIELFDEDYVPDFSTNNWLAKY